MNSKLLPVLFLLVGVVAGFIGGFQYRGMSFKKQMTSLGEKAGVQRFAAGKDGGIVGGGMMRGGSLVGTIVSMDDKSVTVKMQDGSSKIVLFTEKTTYTNTQNISVSELEVGSEVSVIGAPNSDGSVTANNIQLDPVFFRSTPTPQSQ